MLGALTDAGDDSGRVRVALALVQGRPEVSEQLPKLRPDHQLGGAVRTRSPSAIVCA
jgi:hypothetical protein